MNYESSTTASVGSFWDSIVSTEDEQSDHMLCPLFVESSLSVENVDRVSIVLKILKLRVTMKYALARSMSMLNLIKMHLFFHGLILPHDIWE